MAQIDIAIYGAGGFAREVAWLVQTCGKEYRVVCFIDDNIASHGDFVNDIPVWGLDEAFQRFPMAQVVPAIGAPKIREQVVEKAAARGFSFASMIHPGTQCSKWIEFGEGTVICAGNILTTNIVLRCHVQINLGCTIGHDVIMGDFVTLAPGVHVSGWVHFGKRVYVGTGAVIINGTQDKPLIIEDDAIIGAGACVTKSVSAGTTVVGIPARPLKKD